eukprot:4990257-Amphidinium_carterae.2
MGHLFASVLTKVKEKLAELHIKDADGLAVALHQKRDLNKELQAMNKNRFKETSLASLGAFFNADADPATGSWETGCKGTRGAEIVLQIFVVDKDGNTHKVELLNDDGFSGDISLPKDECIKWKLRRIREQTVEGVGGTKTIHVYEGFRALLVLHERATGKRAVIEKKGLEAVAMDSSLFGLRAQENFNINRISLATTLRLDWPFIRERIVGAPR